MADSGEVIKKCPGCDASFTAEQIRDDPEVTPIGMMFEPELGYHDYYFNHDAQGCGTTFVVEAEKLIGLIDEAVPEEALTGTDACSNHCMRIDDLQECGSNCRYAPFRRFLLDLRKSKDA